MKILVVDDEEPIRSLLTDFLEAMGHQVVEAANGVQALFMIREVMPDVTFLDIRMPHMDGMEALRLMKEISSQFIVVIISGIATTDMACDLLKYGAFDYINKPIDFKHLQHLLKTIEDQR
ncbi:MAG: response regulator [Candidatus Latescibacteria bacterium]|nr:response regulator [Candidatus Latescibacterota bacterium]